MAAKHGVLTWYPQKAVSNIRGRLIAATERASAQGADRAREIAPLGKGEHQATGANPRFFALRLQTLREFDRQHGKKIGQAHLDVRARLESLRSLRTPNSLLAEFNPATDTGFFVFSSGSHKGEHPDVARIEKAPGRKGKESIKGATTHYTPGTLKKGIHPIDVKVDGKIVIGGYASEAPYSNVVEHGFHHKGGTEVEGKHFMSQSTEDLRAPWSSGQFFKE